MSPVKREILTERRRNLNIWLTPGAKGALQSFAEANGCSAAGLVEAWLRDLQDDIEQHGTDIRQDWVKKGRAIDAGHRRRT